MKRNNFMYIMIIVAILIITIPLAGCSDSGSNSAVETTTAETTDSTTTALETNPALKNEILIESNTFKPDNITIKLGDTITWVNNDSYAHTVKASSGEFDSGNMASGAKFSFTFTKEGTYDYICGIHTFMKGTITVTK